MPRATISFSEEQHSWIAKQVNELDRSQAAIVRAAVDVVRGEESRIARELVGDGDTFTVNSGESNTSVGADRTDTPAGESSDGGASLRDRVGELEERLADLEAAGVNAGSETAVTASSEAGHERGEEPADPVATGDAGDHEAAASDEADTGEGVDVIEAAIERAADSWGDDARIDDRKAAARAVLRALRDEPMSKSEILDEFADEYPVSGQSPKTWFRKNLAEGADAPLKALATYDAGSQKWRWSGAE